MDSVWASPEKATDPLLCIKIQHQPLRRRPWLAGQREAGGDFPGFERDVFVHAGCAFDYLAAAGRRRSRAGGGVRRAVADVLAWPAL